MTQIRKKRPGSLAASARCRIPFLAQPMLATLVAQPFDRPGWVYEEKYDGDRVIAYKEGSRVRLLSRNGKDRTKRFPGIAAGIKQLRPLTLLLDGEVVVFDRHHVSRFQLLQQNKGHAVYVIFDCLYCGGRDLRELALVQRRSILEQSVGATTVLSLSRNLGSNGLRAYNSAKRKGYEGLIAKDPSSPYIEARSRNWLKVKVHQEDEFLICGYTKPAGARQHFGALLLGAYDGRQIRYVGKVGTGFNRSALEALHRKFRALIRLRSPFVDYPSGKHVVFLSPRLIAQISFQEWTADGKLRQPVFLGLRDDKSAREVVIPRPR